MKKDKIPSAVLTIVEMPEWKHQVLKVLAFVLFIKKANYILIISDFEEL